MRLRRGPLVGLALGTGTGSALVLDSDPGIRFHTAQPLGAVVPVVR